VTKAGAFLALKAGEQSGDPRSPREPITRRNRLAIKLALSFARIGGRGRVLVAEQLTARRLKHGGVLADIAHETALAPQ
jgi:hypothetical protein